MHRNHLSVARGVRRPIHPRTRSHPQVHRNRKRGVLATTSLLQRSTLRRAAVRPRGRASERTLLKRAGGRRLVEPRTLTTPSTHLRPIPRHVELILQDRTPLSLLPRLRRPYHHHYLMLLQSLPSQAEASPFLSLGTPLTSSHRPSPSLRACAWQS